MSDLSDLASDVAKDLPAQVRKVIDAAIENGWTLNKPGMTLALRLNHPTDELAQPVYITWVVSRTPTGRLSFKHDSCGTKGLHPLSGADLIEYLKDPTVVYPVEDEPPWDTEEPLSQDELLQSLGASPVPPSPVSSPISENSASASPLKLTGGTAASARSTQTIKPLRVTIPGRNALSATGAESAETSGT